MIIFSVDDASLARLVIKKATLELGYQFDEAPDGEAAIRKLLSIKEEVSAIFLDWHMPKMNGITFLEEVKKYPTLKDIPIVMATSDSKQKNVFRALKAGAANYIFKPYSSDAIMIKIVETVKKIEPKKQTTKINPDSKDEDLIKAMMEATPIGIIIFDKKDRTILNINQYALKNFFDTTKDKCLGQNIDEKILLISKPRTPEVDHSVCNNEKRRLISLHGPIDVVTTIVPIIYQGKECYFETLNDISAITNEHARLEIANQKLKKSHNQLEKSLEEVKLAHKIKSEFLANMSHELRTPLNGIIGFTGILLEDQLQDDQRESLDTIKLCSDNLLTLINDVLDITKIESNKLTLENIPFNIEDILYDANDMIRAKVEDKSLELLVDTRNTFALVMGDPTRLKQVFTNLLGNAIKFTNSGEIVS
ncbi:response regulator, partial [bacterium]|nr:response regulator [bacterium]